MQFLPIPVRVALALPPSSILQRGGAEPQLLSRAPRPSFCFLSCDIIPSGLFRRLLDKTQTQRT